MPTIPGAKWSQKAIETALAGDEYFLFQKAGTNKRIIAADMGLGGFISKTYAALSTDKSNSVLIKGALYFITDKFIYVRALDVDELALEARLIARNADYQVVGNYSGVSGFNSQKGIWHSGIGPVVIGDVVIWNNRHWRNKTGAVGTAPDGDGVNWEVLAIAENTGHIFSEIDFIEYDFGNDWIQYRKDKRGNSYRYSKRIDDSFLGNGSSAIASFQWGRDLCYSNTIDEALCKNQNLRNEYTVNTMELGSRFQHTVSNPVCNFSGNIQRPYSQFLNCTFGVNSQFFYNVIESNVQFSSNTIGNAQSWESNVFNQNLTSFFPGFNIQNTGKVFYKKLTIPTASVLDLNATPIEIIAAPGANLFVEIIGAEFRMDYVSVQYATNTTLQLWEDTSTYIVASLTNALAGTSDKWAKMVTENVANLGYQTNAAVNVAVSGGNPTAGDSDVIIYVTYTIRIA